MMQDLGYCLHFYNIDLDNTILWATCLIGSSAHDLGFFFTKQQRGSEFLNGKHVRRVKLDSFMHVGFGRYTASTVVSLLLSLLHALTPWHFSSVSIHPFSYKSSLLCFLIREVAYIIYSYA